MFCLVLISCFDFNFSLLIDDGVVCRNDMNVQRSNEVTCTDTIIITVLIDYNNEFETNIIEK